MFLLQLRCQVVTLFEEQRSKLKKHVSVKHLFLSYAIVVNRMTVLEGKPCLGANN